MLFLYLFLFRDVFIWNKVLFPSNFLAQFYSPYKTNVFAGWEQGIPHKPIGTDQIRFFAPSRQFTNDQLHEWKLPFWNPYIFSGSPHLADFQSAVFSPVTLLFFVLPFWGAWNIFIIIQPLFATLGMVLYLRRLNLSRPSKLIGGIAFGLSGFMTVWIYENSVVALSALFLPYILWSFERFVSERKFRWTLLQVIFMVLCFYSGFFQVAFYIYGFTGIYMVIRFLQNKSFSIRAAIYIVLVFITTLLLSAPQLIPSVEGYLASARTKSDVSYLFETYLISPLNLLKVLTPDLQGSPGSYNYFGRGFYHETVLFIGTVPFLVALFALKNWRNRFVLIFGGTLLGTLLLTLKSPLTEFLYNQPIPLLSTFVPSRILVLGTFSLAVLSALGADMLFKVGNKYKIYVTLLFLLIQGAVFAIGFFAVSGENIVPVGILNALNIKGEYYVRNSTALFRNSALSLLLGLGFLFYLYLMKYKRAFYLALIVMTFGQLLYFHQKYMTIGERDFIYPPHAALEYIRNNQGFDRTIAIGESIQGNLYLPEKIYSPEGLDPIYPYEYGVLAHSAKNREYVEDIPRIEVNISDQSPSDFMNNTALQKFIKMDGVRYILYFTKDHEPTISANMNLVKDNENWKIYELEDRLPRVFFADSATSSSSLRARTYLTLSEDRPDGEIVLEEDPPVFFPPQYDDAVGIVKYNPEEVQIRALTSGPRLVFFSDSYYPGWRAYVNGNQTKIYRANTAFRAVRVPAGDSLIEFKYDGRMTEYGFDLMIVGVFVLCVIWYSFSIKRQ